MRVLVQVLHAGPEERNGKTTSSENISIVRVLISIPNDHYIFGQNVYGTWFYINISPGRRDGIQPDAVRLSGLPAYAGGDDAVRLALPVGHLAPVADHDVARLSRGVRANDALHRDDLPDHRVLGLVRVEGDVGLVKVRVRLEEVLLPGSPVGRSPGMGEQAGQGGGV